MSENVTGLLGPKADEKYLPENQRKPTPVYQSDTLQRMESDNKINAGSALLDEAKKKYGFINNNDVAVSINKKDSPYFSETYHANDPGDSEYPRPRELPLDKHGIEVYRPDNVSIGDIAGEVLHVDPIANQYRDELFKSFTQKQIEALKKESGDYQDVTGKASENDKLRNATDSVIRGYVIGQWPEERVNKVLNAEQKRMLNHLTEYMITGKQ